MPDSNGENGGNGGGAGLTPAAAALAERLAKGDVEQQITVEMDYVRGMAIFSVRERFAITPSVFGVPFGVLDFVQWQRLTVQLQAAGVLQQAMAQGAAGGSGPRLA
jgi:hypothetical protein